MVLFAGDFNYRLDVEYEMAIAYLSNPNDPSLVQELLGFDQLRRERANDRVFDGYDEGPITFLPTYKIMNGTTGEDLDGEAMPSATS